MSAPLPRMPVASRTGHATLALGLALSLGVPTRVRHQPL